jgi:hypothetical protein
VPAGLPDVGRLTSAFGGLLNGVAATSARSACAVAFTYRPTPVGKTLILRWNGTAWK